jgi:hypothetical protein
LRSRRLDEAGGECAASPRRDGVGPPIFR